MERAGAAWMVGLVLALSGCLQASEASVGSAAADVGPDPSAAPVEMLEWSGHVLSSELDPLAHTRPTEDLLWPHERDGFIAMVPEGVSEMEVTLAWDGPGEFMIMLHSHVHGTGPNDVLMHTSERDAQSPKCIRVPAADLAPGRWEFMARSSGATQTDFTLTVRTVGGAAEFVDERHGHWRQDDVLNGRKDTDGEVEPCALEAPARQGL